MSPRDTILLLIVLFTGAVLFSASAAYSVFVIFIRILYTESRYDVAFALVVCCIITGGLVKALYTHDH